VISFIIATGFIAFIIYIAIKPLQEAHKLPVWLFVSIFIIIILAFVSTMLFPGSIVKAIPLYSH
jgi:hypothetical protein